MAVLIELPEHQAFLLKQYCDEAQISETEAVGQALSQFLARITQKFRRTLRRHIPLSGFGGWSAQRKATV